MLLGGELVVTEAQGQAVPLPRTVTVPWVKTLPREPFWDGAPVTQGIDSQSMAPPLSLIFPPTSPSPEASPA